MAVWNHKNKGEADAIGSLANESDRGAAIIAAAYLEDRLRGGIIQKLRRDSKATKNIIDDLFRPGGPIGSFSVKIQLGFLMRIYGKQVFHELKTINKIRNKFAHVIGHNTALSFESEMISSMCNELKIIEHYVLPLSDSKHLNIFKNTVVENARRSGSICGKDYKKMLSGARYRYINTCGILAERFQNPDYERDPALPDEYLILGDESFPLP